MIMTLIMMCVLVQVVMEKVLARMTGTVRTRTYVGIGIVLENRTQ